MLYWNGYFFFNTLLYILVKPPKLSYAIFVRKADIDVVVFDSYISNINKNIEIYKMDIVENNSTLYMLSFLGLASNFEGYLENNMLYENLVY